MNYSDDSLSLWQTNTIRLTTFISPDSIIDSNWWEDVIGAPPEVITSRPQLAGQHFEGQIQAGKMYLEILPFRVDWLLSPVDTTLLIKDGIPSLGGFPIVLDIFYDIVMKWFNLKTCPKTKRIAFGDILFQPVKNRVEGYEVLSNYLKSVTLDPVNSYDFMYQINRRRKSNNESHKVYINRLTKWSVLMQTLILSQPALRGLGQSYPQQSFGVFLEQDINTSDDFEGEFNPTDLPVMFDELINLGKEIAIKGEIA
jgi:hypothetical protein